MHTRVKICCISSLSEVQMAVSKGAHCLGLVSAMPSGPGIIEEGLIGQLITQTPPGVDTFLLTSHTTVAPIVDQWNRLRPSTIQLVDYVPTTTLAALKQALPGVKLVPVIHVNNEAQALEQALAMAPLANALLLDSGQPNASIKTLGGTGQTHNWQISKRLVQAVRVPVFLAGGLNADNVQQAIQTVRPYGVDLCSGVRSNGQLDAVKLGHFMQVALNGH